MPEAALKIALLVTNDISQDQRMHRIAHSLKEMGLEVELIGRLKKKSIPLRKRSYETIRLKLPFNSGPMFYLNYNIAVFRYLQKSKPDLVYAVDLDSLLAAAAFKWLRSDISLIFDAHEHFTEVPELGNSPGKKKLWDAVANWGIPRADLCLTVGPALARIFSKKYGRTFYSIRNTPVIKKDAPVNYRADNKILLYQGMLNKGRGLEVAVDAMEELADWTLWLVGHGDIENDLRDRAKKSTASDRIVFHGFVEPDELPAITPQATLGLNLLLADSLSYYYSLANKTFDYMAYGIPAVHMNFPEYREIQEKHQCLLLLDNLKSDCLIRLILSLSTQLLEDLHRKNIEASANYQWHLESEKLKKLVQILLIGKQPSS